MTHDVLQDMLSVLEELKENVKPGTIHMPSSQDLSVPSSPLSSRSTSGVDRDRVLPFPFLSLLTHILSIIPGQPHIKDVLHNAVSSLSPDSNVFHACRITAIAVSLSSSSCSSSPPSNSSTEHNNNGTQNIRIHTMNNHAIALLGLSDTIQYQHQQQHQHQHQQSDEQPTSPSSSSSSNPASALIHHSSSLSSNHGNTLRFVARMYAAGGQYTMARSLLSAYIDNATRGRVRERAETCLVLGEICMRQGDLVGACGILSQAEAVSWEVGAAGIEAHSLLLTAQARLLLGEYREAERVADNCRALPAATSRSDIAVSAAALSANAASHRGEHRRATALMATTEPLVMDLFRSVKIPSLSSANEGSNPSPISCWGQHTASNRSHPKPPMVSIHTSGTTTTTTTNNNTTTNNTTSSTSTNNNNNIARTVAVPSSSNPSVTSMDITGAAQVTALRLWADAQVSLAVTGPRTRRRERLRRAWEGYEAGRWCGVEDIWAEFGRMEVRGMQRNIYYMDRDPDHDPSPGEEGYDRNQDQDEEACTLCQEARQVQEKAKQRCLQNTGYGHHVFSFACAYEGWAAIAWGRVSQAEEAVDRVMRETGPRIRDAAVKTPWEQWRSQHGASMISMRVGMVQLRVHIRREEWDAARRIGRRQMYYAASSGDEPMRQDAEGWLNRIVLHTQPSPRKGGSPSVNSHGDGHGDGDSGVGPPIHSDAGTGREAVIKEKGAIGNRCILDLSYGGCNLPENKERQEGDDASESTCSMDCRFINLLSSAHHTFPNLVSLDISHNTFLHNTLPLGTVLQTLPRLEHFTASHCQVDRISEFEPHLPFSPRLRSLILSDNNIRDLPAALHICIRLAYIDLMNNPVDAPLPAELGLISGLESIESSAMLRTATAGHLRELWGSVRSKDVSGVVVMLQLAAGRIWVTQHTYVPKRVRTLLDTTPTDRLRHWASIAASMIHKQGVHPAVERKGIQQQLEELCRYWNQEQENSDTTEDEPSNDTNDDNDDSSPRQGSMITSSPLQGSSSNPIDQGDVEQSTINDMMEQALEPLPEPELVEGSVWKRSDHLRKWNQRYLRLEGFRELWYWRAQEAEVTRRNTARGKFDLTRMRQVEACQVGRMALALRIRFTERPPLLLGFDTDTERTRWQEAFDRCRIRNQARRRVLSRVQAMQQGTGDGGGEGMTVGMLRENVSFVKQWISEIINN